MVLLHDSFDAAESEELAPLPGVEEQDDDDDDDEAAEEEEPDLDSSNPGLKAHHNKRSFKPALKVAAKASTAVAKSGTKATVAVGKAGAKAMKGVLGFGRKKKGHKLDLNSSTAGLIIEDDLLDDDEDDDNGGGQWSTVDEHQPEFDIVKTTDTLYMD